MSPQMATGLLCLFFSGVAMGIHLATNLPPFAVCP
jgi:hypothetical protein